MRELAWPVDPVAPRSDPSEPEARGEGGFDFNCRECCNSGKPCREHATPSDGDEGWTETHAETIRLIAAMEFPAKSLSRAALMRIADELEAASPHAQPSQEPERFDEFGDPSGTPEAKRAYREWKRPARRSSWDAKRGFLAGYAAAMRTPCPHHDQPSPAAPDREARLMEVVWDYLSEHGRHVLASKPDDDEDYAICESCGGDWTNIDAPIHEADCFRARFAAIALDPPTEGTR